MKITKLTLTNVRAFKHAKLEFRPGMNLLVGLNGLGKTTVLNVLCNMLAPVLSHVNGMKGDNAPLTVGDIRQGTDALDITLECEVPGSRITSTYHKPSKDFVAHETGKVRGAVTNTRERRSMVGTKIKISEPALDRSETQIAIFFSTKRTIPTESHTSPRKSGGEISAALADALSSRELRLADIAQWMKNQEVLGKEEPRRLRHLEAMRKAAKRFLPDCSNLRAETKPSPNLLVDKKVHDKLSTFSVRQLSDGERSMLVIALVIAQKLSQSHPNLDDPIRDSKAVILIDELDLHLHPQWQRTIVAQLTKTFPKCQFIATTHSPQIIGEVKHKHIQILHADDVFNPPRSLGLDSSRVLEELMDASPANRHLLQKKGELAEAIDKDKFPHAEELLEVLVKTVGENDPDVTRARTLISFLKDAK